MVRASRSGGQSTPRRSTASTRLICHTNCLVGRHEQDAVAVYEPDLAGDIFVQSDERAQDVGAAKATCEPARRPAPRRRIISTVTADFCPLAAPCSSRRSWPGLTSLFRPLLDVLRRHLNCGRPGRPASASRPTLMMSTARQTRSDNPTAEPAESSYASPSRNVAACSSAACGSELHAPIPNFTASLRVTAVG